jgi:hypothetical protein
VGFELLLALAVLNPTAMIGRRRTCSWGNVTKAKAKNGYDSSKPDERYRM